MKKRNLYYYTVFKRGNNFKMLFLTFFLAICSWPRTFIENFTRTSLGERYYSPSLCVLMTVILTLLPFKWSYEDHNYLEVIGNNLSWYVYTVAYAWYAYKRYLEVKREPGAYDFRKFSLSSGIVHPSLADLELFKKQQDRRLIPTVFEPGIFFVGGVALAFLKQPIGAVLAMSAIIYSLSWCAQFHQGDQFVLDTIDEMIANEEMVSTFVHRVPPQGTKGFEFYGNAPQNPGFRRRVADQMMEDEPPVDVV